jgi:hypothetical protein
MSVEYSSRILTNSPQWQTTENEHDPLKFWLLIKATHLGNQGNLTTRRLI